MRAILAKLRALFAVRRDKDEFDDEIRHHIQLLTERYIRDGMSFEDAASAARRQFGNRTRLSENRNELRTFAPLETLARDLRYGLRQLRSNFSFTAIAVLCLALGIGANTAVFTLLDQLVLRLLPVKDPARLVMIWSTGPPLGYENGLRASSYPMYQDFARRASAFDYVFCRFDQQLAMSVDRSTGRVDGELVSGNYFQALGVGPALGRVFSPESDDRIYEGHPVVVLSYRYWKHRFAGDPNIIGSKILLNNYPMQVIGVAAPNFAGLDPSRSPDLWVPIQMKPLMTPAQDGLGDRRGNWIQIFARLKPGYTVASASASLQPLFHQILLRELATDPQLRQVSQYDRNRFLHRTVILETAANGYSGMRQQYSTALVLLMAMAGLILFIACANVAGLLIARAGARQKEIAVRLAIGAARRTIIRQLLIESLLLSLAGTALGILLSVLTTRALLRMLPDHGANLLLSPNPDPRILLFSILTAIATGLLFGIAPALHGTRVDVAFALKDAAASLAGTMRAVRLRKTLVTAQVALSFLLLIGAGLFARTLANLKNTRTGFQDLSHIATFQIDPAKLGYPPLRIRDFYENLARDLGAIPGVESAAYSVVPVFGGDWWGWGFAVEGHQAKHGESMQAHVNVISPGYFRTMGVPLLRGRDFDSRDRFTNRNLAQMPDVAIVNRKFAEHFFGSASPIGRHIGNQNMGGKLTVQIIGEIENSLYEGPRSGVPLQVFYSHSEAPVPLRAYFYVRTRSEPASLFAAFRRAISKLDPGLPVDDMRTLDTQLDDTLSTERLIAFLSVAFGLLATLLAALGLYGVMAFAIARRTKEIGLRIALGAPRASVLALVTREIVVLLAIGLAIGAPAAVFLSRYAQSQLFGVTPADLSIWFIALFVLCAAAAASALIPARRATSIDPIRALRYE